MLFNPMINTDIEIENNESYEQIVNYTMLYDSGDECTDVTGGWSADGYGDNGGYTVVQGTKNADNFYLVGASNKTSLLGTDNAINLEGYSKAGVMVKTSGYSSSSLEFHIGRTKSRPHYTENRIGGNSDINVTEKTLIFCDVNSDENAYFVFMSMGTSSRNGNVYDVFLTKPDDIKALGNKAGVTVTDLDSLLADTTALATIFNNEDAVKFMVAQCTGDFMVGVCNNAEAMTELCNSIAYDYAFNNEHWYKFMTMCPVALNAMDSVAVTVPTMTSNTTPSGVVSASDEQSGFEAYRAFDNDNTTGWITHAGVSLPASLHYEFPNELDFYKFEIENTLISDDFASVTNGNISLDGVVITSFSNIPVGGSFTFIADKKLRGKKVTITLTSKNGTWSSGQCKIFEAQFYGKAVAE